MHLTPPSVPVGPMVRGTSNVYEDHLERSSPLEQTWLSALQAPFSTMVMQGIQMVGCLAASRAC